MGTKDHASIGIDYLETSLRRELKELLPLSKECCIYMVPQPIRQFNESAYSPKVVSIGPLHHGRKELIAMEEYKRRCLNDFLKRTKVNMKVFLQFITKNEARLRDCYAESIDLGSDEFVKMILVDSAFLIELLLRNFLPDLETSHDHIFTKPWMIHHIRPDLWLLENQLPMFILEELYNLADIVVPFVNSEELSMVTLNRHFWSRDCEFLSVGNNLIEFNFSKATHFLDLLRLCIQLPSPMRLPKSSTYQTIPSVRELHEAGVQFNVDSNSLFEITFDEGILEIPRLTINGFTKSLFINLQVFQQLHTNENFLMGEYITIMNYLVSTPKDLEILIQHDIIDNGLKNEEEASNLFHDLVEWSTFIPCDFNNYSYFVEDQNRYYRSNKGTWQKWKTFLKRDYFNTPWATISVIAAIILLILSFIQAFFSIVKIN